MVCIQCAHAVTIIARYSHKELANGIMLQLARIENIGALVQDI